MYGMVNKAIEDLVTDLKGAAAWEALKRDADVDVETFVGMDRYDDAVTYRLVDAAARMFGMPPEEVLEAFGEYWTVYTANQGYGHLMSAAGNSVFEVLENLDAMHTRLAMIYPDMRIPQFRLTRDAAGQGWLSYRSDRPGLGAMVVGLLKGLGRRFDTPVTVAWVARREDGADADRFRVALEV